MRYTVYILQSTIHHKCAECGSRLILISKVTEKLSGSLFPQTTFKYRCTDIDCQERKDKELEKRLILHKEKLIIENKRHAERHLKKHRLINIKL